MHIFYLYNLYLFGPRRRFGIFSASSSAYLPLPWLISNFILGLFGLSTRINKQFAWRLPKLGLRFQKQHPKNSHRTQHKIKIIFVFIPFLFCGVICCLLRNLDFLTIFFMLRMQIFCSVFFLYFLIHALHL